MGKVFGELDVCRDLACQSNVVWCRARSSIDAWNELGYTVLFGQHPLEALQLFNGTSEMVVNIFMDPVDLSACYNYQHPHPLLKRELTAVQGAYVVEGDEPSAEDLRRLGDEDVVPGVEGWVNLVGDEYEPDDAVKGCVKREGFEHGFPLALVFAWSFWPGDYHPVHATRTCARLLTDARSHTYVAWPRVDDGSGANERIHARPSAVLLPWYVASGSMYCSTLTKIDVALGYSIEKYCTPHFRPHANRSRRAFVLGKYSMYLDNPELCAWSTAQENETFGYLANRIDGLGFAGTFQDAETMTDRGIENFGLQTVDGFYELLGDNKVLVSALPDTISLTRLTFFCISDRSRLARAESYAVRCTMP